MCPRIQLILEDEHKATLLGNLVNPVLRSHSQHEYWTETKMFAESYLYLKFRVLHVSERVLDFYSVTNAIPLKH